MTLPKAEAFFVTDDGVHFTATQYSRGPWAEDACHGGPPTALMVRALELLDPQKQLARITNDIIRPIPTTGFTVEAEIWRQGRSVTSAAVRIRVGDKIHAQGTGVLLRESPTPDGLRTADVPIPIFKEARDGTFPVEDIPHGMPSFGSAVEVKYAPGSDNGSGGPTTMWMRTTVPILEHEDPSGFQMISPLSDCANGVSPNQPFTEITALNPDLTVVFHREPRGDWFAMDSVTHAHSNGIGATESRLFDVDGPVGVTAQTILVNRGW
jgi:hypothetical protein